MDFKSLETGRETNTGFTSYRNEKDIETLEKELKKYECRIETLTSLSRAIEEVSLHPRVESRCKLSKFVDVECLLTTSEYKLKYADYSVIASLKGTSQYIQKSIDDAKEMIECCKHNINKLQDQKLLAQTSYGRKVNVVDTERGSLTFYDNGLVDIVENDAETYKKHVRKVRFKTIAERDSYLKQRKKDA